MDHELLVDDQIEDGRELIGELARGGFDVTVAFWARTSEEGLWSLYIGSTSLASMTMGDAFRAVYEALRRIPSASIALSDVKLVEATNPIVASAVEARDRHPGRSETRSRWKRLGDSIEAAYIYPPTGPMTRSEVVQAVASLMNRTGVLSPSLVTLRDGTQIHAVPVGIQMSTPGAVQIVLHDIVASTNRSFSADDVIGIQ